MKVLITGIAGHLGRMVASRLHRDGWDVIGIDRRPWPDAPRGVELVREDIRKRPAEDVFRTRRPDALIHMGTVTHFTTRFEQRYRINLGGTRAVFDHAAHYGVKQAIFVGRHTYYGAAGDSPLYHHESDPPLAVSTFPDLSDLVAADLYAGTALWQHPEMDTAVLRICYTLGPSRAGTLANFLRGPAVPTVFGFDPLFQFMHEWDAVDAIATALGEQIRGVFNVAGPQPVPLSVLIRATGRRRVPVLEPLFDAATGRMGLPDLPDGAKNHVKFAVVVDDASFRAATGFDHRFDEVATMESFRSA